MKYYSIIAILIFLMSCTNKRTEIILNAENVDGLTTKANITLNGFEIGKVEDLNLTSEGTIDIKCKLKSDIKIPVDSKFTIESINLLGTKGIFVKLGESPENLKNGDNIKLSKIEPTNLEDSLAIKVGDFLESITGKQKQDSILIELHRLNDNLEKQHK
ncbi:MlaD family protein [Tenacibaculum aiptasiae]|uniref:MlaD family protein n=1 Tax=Tenacibaculum aiptasiae TaxID=426481 RepID=UPI003B5BF1F7